MTALFCKPGHGAQQTKEGSFSVSSALRLLDPGVFLEHRWIWGEAWPGNPKCLSTFLPSYFL